MVDVYGLFKTSYALELGLHKLEEEGFGRDRLSVVVLDTCIPAQQSLLDSMYSADGMSLADGVAMASSVGMVLGVIYGSVSCLGPVALGLAGMAAGGAAGFALDRHMKKKKQVKGAPPAGEVIVVVNCSNREEAVRVESIMKEYHAAALGCRAAAEQVRGCPG